MTCRGTAGQNDSRIVTRSEEILEIEKKIFQNLRDTIHSLVDLNVEKSRQIFVRGI